MDLPKVLIIDDDHFYQSHWLQELAGRAAVIRAFDQEAARELFRDHPDVAVIVMDGYVPGLSEATTVELTKELRAKFKGPILAVSSSINKALKEAGCDRVCEDKDLVGEEVTKLLEARHG